MPTKIITRTATTKASLVRSLRANNIKFKFLKTIKKSGKTTVGQYKIKIWMKY